MRNLKKTLCLTLALVFVLGLCTVGAAGTTYGDEEQIQYETAVKAMSGLGILQGDDNDGDGVNEFRPKDPVTRAQAAKIIAYMCLGKDNAELWPAGKTFDDVPESHWAIRYIAYCQFNGIINGMGDGTFHPDDPVTQAAFCKMVLAAAGYGKKGELTGPNWQQEVANLSLQGNVQKGLLRSAWDEPATREETALLAYNGMMNVVQVVLSKDTDSYVPQAVGSGTLAAAVWSLQTTEGVIVANKSNTSGAKGTVLNGIQPQSYYVTEFDNDASKLGHLVTITYRMETVNGGEVAVAYYVDDSCREVSGKEAAKADDALVTYAFENGQLSTTPVPAKSVRADAPGTFVLDKDGKVVSYKDDTYFLATLAMSSGHLTVTEPYGGTTVEVNAPAGAKAGDIVTVFKFGDIYTAQPTVKLTGVVITQSQQDKTTGRFTYNDGAITLTKADKFALASFSSLTKMDGTNQLELNYSYTLYFDCKGGCFGFADKAGAGAVVTSDCVFLVTTYTGKDSYGSDIYKAQIILKNGAVEEPLITKDTYDTGLVPGVYKTAVSNGFTSFTPASGTEMTFTTYSTENPLVDFSGATFVYYKGSKGSLQVETNAKPQKDSYVYYTFKTEKVGTVDVRKVGTVWFTVPEVTAITVADSFIYVADTAVESTRLVDGTARSYYPGYLNGEKMNDLALSAAPAKTGLATYTKDAKGFYTLTYMPDGTGAATGVRTGLMTDNPTDFYILNNKLYVKDAGGKLQGMDVSALKVVKTGAAATSAVVINSVATLQQAILDGYKVTVTFVETVSGETHAIGGLALYVTNIA